MPKPRRAGHARSVPKTVERPAEPTVAAIVREQTGVSWSRARDLCTEGRVTVDGKGCFDPALRIAADAVVVVDRGAPKRHLGPLQRDAIVYSDRDVVVVDKPAGVLSVADEADNRDTLLDHTRTLLRKVDKGGKDTRLGVVHRLDKDTSGLMVFTRSVDAKRILQAAFKTHDIERVYYAIAHGRVPETRVESDLLLDRGDGLRGSYGIFRRASGTPPADAKHAVTFFRPIAVLGGATLVECRLETGRQHQIRIHLAELGHPLVGERVYIRDYAGLKIESARPMLHARVLGFTHPRSGEPLLFERDPPEDFEALLEALRPAA